MSGAAMTAAKAGLCACGSCPVRNGWASRPASSDPAGLDLRQVEDVAEDRAQVLAAREGGGDETRSNAWLAELQQEMFVEMNPRDANNAGVKDGDDVWLEGAEGARIRVKAQVTRRVAAGVAFMPFHFGGHFEGRDLRDKYPAGSDPYVLGEACNTAMTYGYDSVTQMQETKCSLCRISKA